MFLTKKKKIIVPVLIFVGLAVLAVLLFSGGKNEVSPDLLNVTDMNGITEFLEAYGYKTVSQPVQCRTFTLPMEFDDVLLEYNELQKSQNFDLIDFKGKSVTVWSFIVTNYPGYSNSDAVRASVIVYNGRIIGGDICSTEIDGFMHGFNKTEEKNGKNQA